MALEPIPSVRPRPVSANDANTADIRAAVCEAILGQEQALEFTYDAR
jgi:hypothetical protein